MLVAGALLAVSAGYLTFNKHSGNSAADSDKCLADEVGGDGTSG
ncbi:MAG: hypothetical protein OXF99_03485 [bacterium]|nr:hypothetical protein [bacterium]